MSLDPTMVLLGAVVGLPLGQTIAIWLYIGHYMLCDWLEAKRAKERSR